jgi:hypothetical protein
MLETKKAFKIHFNCGFEGFFGGIFGAACRVLYFGITLIML